MTVIVGMETADGVWLASDSRSASGDIYRDNGSKLVDLPCGAIIGACGWRRVSQVLQYDTVYPRHESGETDMEWLVGKFAPAVYTSLSRYKLETDTDSDPSLRAAFIMAYRGRLYDVDSTLCIRQMSFTATGSGYGEALACRYALDAVKLYKPEYAERIVRLAVETAAAVVPNCGGKVHTVYQTRPGESAGDDDLPDGKGVDNNPAKYETGVWVKVGL